MIDTGAQVSLLDFEFVAEASKREVVVVRGSTGMGVGWQVEGVNLRFDKRTVPVGFAVGLHDLSEGHQPIDAIVGLDFMEGFTVEFDPVDKMVRLYSPDDYRPSPEEDTIPFRLVDGRPVVTGELRLPGRSEKEVAILIDTGGIKEIDVTYRRVRQDKLDHYFEQAPTINVGGGIGGEGEGKRIGRGEVRLGRTVLSGETILGMTKDGSNGKDARYDVVLGTPLLQKCKLVLDHARMRIYVRPNGLK